MAQGKLKKKTASVAKKAKLKKKSLGPKKGARAIPPKKNAKSKVVSVRKKLEIQIKTSIEEEAVIQAGKFEHKSLTLIKKPSAAAGNKNAKGTQKKSGKKGSKKKMTKTC